MDYELYPLEALDLCIQHAITRSITMEERNAIDDSDFAWPDAPDHPKYPIDTQAHLDAAAKLIGRAPEDKQSAIKARAIRIAKRKGFALPDSWKDEKEDDKEERATPSTEHTHDTLTRAANHEPMTGKHSHAHPAHGSQGDDSTHEHEHSHDNDNNHDHEHADKSERAATGVIQTTNRPSIYAPIMRIDAAKREVYGQATAEVPDSYGTIFGFCPEAWTTWRGNIREQHDPKKAVGKAFDIDPDPQTRAVYVGSRVSRGAQDTWLKVEDNVLTGYSVSIIPDPEFGNNPALWPKKEYNGKEYPYLPRYTISELSLVDNPACPGCNIQIVRADGFTTDVIDVTEEEEEKPAPQDALQRSGARVSAPTRDKMHDSITHTLKAAISQMGNCGCDSCMKAQKLIDPDGDGDIDIGSFDDPDQDANDLYNGRDGDMGRHIEGIIDRVLASRFDALFQRFSAIAGTLSRSVGAPQQQTNTSTLESLITSAVNRAVETLPTKSSLDEVRSALAEVKGQVDKIADTPVPGAPVLNTSVLPPPRPTEKFLPTDPNPYTRPASSGSAVADALAQLYTTGQTGNTTQQVDAMAAVLAAQRRGNR